MLPPKLSFDELENPRVMGLLPGDIAYNIYSKQHLPPPSPTEMAIIYGGALPRDFCGWIPHNLYAKIVQGSLDDLSKVAQRIIEKGMEKVWFRRHSA